MRKLKLAVMLAAVSVGAASAQTLNICSRTPVVRDAILAAVAEPMQGRDTCNALAIEQLATIRRLSIDGLGIAALRNGDLAGLTGLRVLELNFNRLAVLPEGLFFGLDSLRELDLSHNQLTTLPEGVFSGLSRLEVLLLGDNRLTTLPRGLFSGLPRLNWLLLHNNHLVGLRAKSRMFAGLQLQVLRLDGQTAYP